MTILHSNVHTPHDNVFIGLCRDVLLEGVIETLILIPFLFLAYLLMEFIEHKAGERTYSLLAKSGKAGPLFGGVLGLAPQCAFSAMASNLYTGRVITLGTLVAVFLATSDEMLLIMISGGTNWRGVLISLAYKFTVGIAVGFIIDIAIRILKKQDNHPHIHEMCENGKCHCEKGIFRSAMHHTLTIGLFILAITLGINALLYFVDADVIGAAISKIPVLSHFLAALIGLIPGCATSVALTSLCLEGIISGGVMMSGLFSGAGMGLIILWRVNRNWRENLAIMGIIVAAGFFFGVLFDITGLSDFIDKTV